MHRIRQSKRGRVSQIRQSKTQGVPPFTYDIIILSFNNITLFGIFSYFLCTHQHITFCNIIIMCYITVVYNV